MRRIGPAATQTEVTDVDRELARVLHRRCANGRCGIRSGPHRHLRSRRVARRARRRHARLLRLRLDDSHSLDLKAPGLKPAPLRAPGAARRRDADDDRAGQRRRRRRVPYSKRSRVWIFRPISPRASIPGLDAYSETLLPKHQFNWARAQIHSHVGAENTSTRPQPELYRWREDPGEVRNVVAGEAARQRGCRRSSRACPRIRLSRRNARRSDVVEAEKFMALGYIGQARAGAENDRARGPIRSGSRDLSAGDVGARRSRSPASPATRSPRTRRAPRNWSGS